MARIVIDVMAYWIDPPPVPTPRLLAWVRKIESGWRPNRRIRQMGYHTASEFYGLYIWEYLNVILPALDGGPADASAHVYVSRSP